MSLSLPATIFGIEKSLTPSIPSDSEPTAKHRKCWLEEWARHNFPDDVRALPLATTLSFKDLDRNRAINIAVEATTSKLFLVGKYVVFNTPRIEKWDVFAFVNGSARNHVTYIRERSDTLSYEEIDRSECYGTNFTFPFREADDGRCAASTLGSLVDPIIYYYLNLAGGLHWSYVVADYKKKFGKACARIAAHNGSGNHRTAPVTPKSNNDFQGVVYRNHPLTHRRIDFIETRNFIPQVVTDVARQDKRKYQESPESSVKRVRFLSPPQTDHRHKARNNRGNSEAESLEKPFSPTDRLDAAMRMIEDAYSEKYQEEVGKLSTKIENLQTELAITKAKHSNAEKTIDILKEKVRSAEADKKEVEGQKLAAMVERDEAETKKREVEARADKLKVKWEKMQAAWADIDR